MRKRFASSGAGGLAADRLISELRLAGASTRGQANKVLDEYCEAHNKRFAVAAQDTQPAWRKAPTDHTQLLDLCALHYVRKVHKNHTVRLQGRVIDIPRPRCGTCEVRGKGGRRQTPAVRRLPRLPRRRMHRMGERLSAEARSRQQQKTTTRTNNRGDTFTEQLGGDIFTLL